MSAVPLTRRQRDILDFFERYVRERGMSPTLEEVAASLGVNKVTVFGHVAELERKGVLSRAGKGISRGLQITADAPVRSSTRISILGRIAAGAPLEVVESTEEFDLADLVPRGGDCYLLVVRGDSMIEDGIRDGDLVLVQRREEPRNGETVVAVLPDHGATLKRWYREKDRIRLQPANSALAPMFVKSVEVRGVVVGLIRRVGS